MMSTRADADLESMIAFREHLLRFNRLLAEEFASMTAHWRALGDVWTDAKYYEFGQALEEAAQGVNRYLTATEGHEAHLRGLIERLREKWPDDDHVVREFIRLLWLHGAHPAERIARAVERALEYGCRLLDGIRLCLHQLTGEAHLCRSTWPAKTNC